MRLRSMGGFNPAEPEIWAGPAICTVEGGGGEGGGGVNAAGGSEPPPAGMTPASGGVAEPPGTPAGEPSAGTPGQGGSEPPAHRPPAWFDPLTENPTTKERLEKAGFKSLDDVVDSQWHLRAAFDQKRSVPADDAPAEEWDKFYNRLGRPEDPTGYEFELPSDLPEDLPYDNDLAEEMRNVFHGQGLNASQARALHDAFASYQAKRFGEAREQQEAQAVERREHMENELRQDPEWRGERFDQNIRAIDEMLSHVPGGDELSGYLKESGMATHAPLLRAFHEITKAVSDDAFVGSGGSAPAPSYEDDVAGLKAKWGTALVNPHHENARAAREAWQQMMARHKPR